MKKIYNLIVILLFTGMLISCSTSNNSISTNSEEKALNPIHSEIEKKM